MYEKLTAVEKEVYDEGVIYDKKTYELDSIEQAVGDSIAREYIRIVFTELKGVEVKQLSGIAEEELKKNEQYKLVVDGRKIIPNAGKSFGLIIQKNIGRKVWKDESELDGVFIIDNTDLLVVCSKAVISDKIDAHYHFKDAQWHIDNMFRPLESLYGIKPEYLLLYPTDVELGEVTRNFLKTLNKKGYSAKAQHYHMGLYKKHSDPVYQIYQTTTIAKIAEKLYYERHPKNKGIVNGLISFLNKSLNKQD